MPYHGRRFFCTSLQQAIILNPEFEPAVVHLGNAYFQQGRYREAVEQYRNYIRVAPSDGERARGYGCIAHVYLKQRDLERSAKAAKQSQTYDRQRADHSILISLERGNLAKAEDLSKRFLAEHSDTGRGQRTTQRHKHYLRGYIYLRSGRAEEAVAAFKEAMRHYALFWHIDSFEDCLANGYLELGRLDEAIAEYERILRLNPNYPLAQYHLAQAFERKGEPERARTAYGRFLEIWKDADLDIPEVVAARQRLSS